MDEALIEFELSKPCYGGCANGRVLHCCLMIAKWCRICGGSGVVSTAHISQLYPYTRCSDRAPYLWWVLDP